MRRALLLVLAACGDDDPCPDVDGACIALTVKSEMFEELDQLELDILYDDLHDTITTALPGDARVKFPLTTQIALDLNRQAPVGIVVAGKLAGTAFAFGEVERTLGASEHVALEVELAVKSMCEVGRNFCGGGATGGNEGTVYRCTAAGVPRARGRCMHGCDVRTGDDVCLPGPLPCTLGGYCGGDKVEGDPSALYTCSGGVGINPMPCTNGCVVEIDNDDHCR